MKKTLQYFVLIILTIIGSCKKEKSYEGWAEKNKPPIAVAGPDRVITLPIDSVSLDGRSSSDPDGSISNYSWTKISGPVSFNIIKPSDSITKVKSLVAGTYLFELKVTDNGGLSAKDTMRVIVDPVLTTNHPPIANAGADQTITLPTNTVNLDGSGSTDPDNNIISYVWTKISGPLSSNITNSNAMQTQITNLAEGVYQFELKVTDVGGLFSKDTIRITVNPELLTPTACNPSNRPLINAHLIPVGILSETRSEVTVVSAGNKILYAGGFIPGPDIMSSRVDIYDAVSNTWTIAALSQARSGIATLVIGNKIFFGGGYIYPNTASARVDIYDFVSNTWSTVELSMARWGMAAAVANNRALFAGGCYDLYGPGSNFLFTNRVDIYDATGNSWSTSALSEARVEFTGSTVGNKIYFAGGTVLFNASDYSSTSTIDIYDASNNSWSTSSLSATKGAHAGVAVNNKIYWAGGRGDGGSNYYGCCVVEIKDVNTQTSSFSNLFQPNAYFEAVLKDNKIVFFTGAGNSTNKFDIYDTSNNSWSIGALPNNISGSIISVNNTIYIAGAVIDGVLSNQVWKLEF